MATKRTKVDKAQRQSDQLEKKDIGFLIVDDQDFAVQNVR
jgi:hypothetical protein